MMYSSIVPGLAICLLTELQTAKQGRKRGEGTSGKANDEIKQRTRKSNEKKGRILARSANSFLFLIRFLRVF
jgi:hypothetical protein